MPHLFGTNHLELVWDYYFEEVKGFHEVVRTLIPLGVDHVEDIIASKTTCSGTALNKAADRPVTTWVQVLGSYV